MDAIARAYEALIRRFVAWAKPRPDIRAAVVVGSWARRHRPADEWADLDLVIITTDPAAYLAQADWLESLGPVWITFVEPTATGQGLERRALFEGGLDVDFTILPLEMLQQVVQDPQTQAILSRGIRVLLDKDGLLPEVISSSGKPPPAPPPTPTEFQALSSNFWYHAAC